MFLKIRGRKPRRLLWDTKNLKSKIFMKSQNIGQQPKKLARK
jgi:hypothetical protein